MRSLSFVAWCALSLAGAACAQGFASEEPVDPGADGGGDDGSSGGPSGTPNPGDPGFPEPDAGTDPEPGDGGSDAKADAAPVPVTIEVNATEFGTENPAGDVLLAGPWVPANQIDDYDAFRFPLAIPAGAEIQSATLSVVFSSNATSPDLILYAQPVPSPPALTAGSKNLSARAKTTATARWQASNLGTGRKTAPSMTSVVREVVSKAGWKSGDSILVLARTPAVSDCWMATPEQDDTNRPKLKVTYLPKP